KQIEVSYRPDLVELVVVRRILPETLQHLSRERGLDGRSQVAEQQRDARAVLPRDQEELIVDVGDDEWATFRRLGSQGGQEDPEIRQDRRRQTPPRHKAGGTRRP